jgi:hypothetical protein
MLTYVIAVSVLSILVQADRKNIEPFAFYRGFTGSTRKITFTRHGFGQVEKSAKQ